MPNDCDLFTHSFSFRISIQSDDVEYVNDLCDSEIEEDDEVSRTTECIPPYLLKTVRFKLESENTYAYVGLLPDTDGYGEAVATILFVLVHNGACIMLNRYQMATFFIALRNAGRYFMLGYHVFDKQLNDFYTHGRCDVEKVGESPIRFNIIFTNGEYDQTRLNDITEADIMRLLELETVIEGRMYNLKLSIDDVLGVINDCVMKYRHNACKIREDSGRWSQDDIEVELAWNHFTTFSMLVSEFYEHNKENTSYF